MRTTIDFRDDLMAELQSRAARRRVTLKEEVNACLERGLGMSKPNQASWKVKTRKMGGINLDPGLVWDLLNAMEAEAYITKRDLAK